MNILASILISTLLLSGCTANALNTQQNNIADKVGTEEVSEIDRLEEAGSILEGLENPRIHNRGNNLIIEELQEYGVLTSVNDKFTRAIFGDYGVAEAPAFKSMHFQTPVGVKAYSYMNEEPISSNYVVYNCKSLDTYLQAIDYRQLGGYALETYHSDIKDYLDKQGITEVSPYDCYLGAPILIDTGNIDYTDMIFPINYVEDGKIQLIGIFYDGLIVEIEGMKEFNETNKLLEDSTGVQQGYQFIYDEDTETFYLEQYTDTDANYEIRLDITYPMPLYIMYS